MSNWRLFIAFLAKLFLLFLIISIAQKIIPYLGFFPYKEVLTNYQLPRSISAMANFDGAHYLLIAKDGYSQYQQAFFPIYPLLIRFLSPLLQHNHLLTGLIISNLSFFLSLLVLIKLLSSLKLKSSSLWFILFILAFPTAFFFHAVYSEGWFFLLLITSLYFIKRGRYFVGGLVAAVASATRLIGVFLFIPLLFAVISSEIKQKQKNWFNLLYVLLPFVGLGSYMFYLLKTTGDPLFFFNSQPAFGANRSTQLVVLPQVYYRYFKIFLLAQKNFAYFTAATEFIIFNFVFIVCFGEFFKQLHRRQWFFVSLSLFSLINVFLPTLTGTLSSVPRYALLSLSVFFSLSQLKNTKIKLIILLLFWLLQMTLFAFFVRGYFVS